MSLFLTGVLIGASLAVLGARARRRDDRHPPAGPGRVPRPPARRPQRRIGPPRSRPHTHPAGPTARPTTAPKTPTRAKERTTQ